MFRSAAARTQAAWKFLCRGLSNFDTTASLLPSSPFLVRATLDPVPLERARCVVELGPGTGVLTEEILARLGPHAHLHAIELDGALLEATRARIADPRLRPVHGDASQLASLVGPECGPGTSDAVVCSLGLSMMDDELRDTIVHSAARALRPGGVFAQYAYLHARWFAYSQDRRRWFRWYARPYLESVFDHVDSTFVPLNVPPAVVYACRDPRGGDGLRIDDAPARS